MSDLYVEGNPVPQNGAWSLGGGSAPWAIVHAGAWGSGIFQHPATIEADVTVAAGRNALSVGPITVGSGITVTVAPGSVWAIV